MSINKPKPKLKNTEYDYETKMVRNNSTRKISDPLCECTGDLMCSLCDK